MNSAKNNIDRFVIILLLSAFVFGQIRNYSDFKYHDNLNVDNSDFDHKGIQVTLNNRIFHINRDGKKEIFVYEITNPLTPTAIGKIDIANSILSFPPNIIEKDNKTYIRFASIQKTYFYEISLSGDTISLAFAKEVTLDDSFKKLPFVAYPVEANGLKNYVYVFNKVVVLDFSDWDNIKMFNNPNFEIDQNDAFLIQIQNQPYLVGISKEYKFFMMDLTNLDHATNQDLKAPFLSTKIYDKARMTLGHGAEITFQSQGKTHCAFWSSDYRVLYIMKLTPENTSAMFVEAKAFRFEYNVLALLMFNIGENQLYAQISQENTEKTRLFIVDEKFEFTERKALDTYTKFTDGHLTIYEKKYYTIWIGESSLDIFEIQLTSCDANKHIDSATPFQCKACSFPCQDCDDFTETCTTCVDSIPSRIVANSCACPDTYIEHNSNAQCLKPECPQYCKYCDPITKRCKECSSSTTVLNNGNCVCKSGYQQSILNPYGDFCDQIAPQCNDPRCQKCNVDQKCFLLKSSVQAFIVNGEITTCKPECSTCEDVFQCLTCVNPEHREKAPSCACRKGLTEKNGICILPDGSQPTGEFSYEKYLEEQKALQQQQNQNQTQTAGGQNVNTGSSGNGQTQNLRKKKDDDGNDTLLLGILVPITVICMLALVGTMCFVMKLKKEMMRQQERQAVMLGEEPAKKGSNILNQQYAKQQSEFMDEEKNIRTHSNLQQMQYNSNQNDDATPSQPFTQNNIETFSRQASTVSISENNSSPTKKLNKKSVRSSSSSNDKLSTDLECNLNQNHKKLGYNLNSGIESMTSLKQSSGSNLDDDSGEVEEDQEECKQSNSSNNSNNSNNKNYKFNKNKKKQGSRLFSSQTSDLGLSSANQIPEEEEEAEKSMAKQQNEQQDIHDEIIQKEQEKLAKEVDLVLRKINGENVQSENEMDDGEDDIEQDEQKQQKTVLIQEKDRNDELDLESVAERQEQQIGDDDLKSIQTRRLDQDQQQDSDDEEQNVNEEEEDDDKSQQQPPEFDDIQSVQQKDKVEFVQRLDSIQDF